MNRVTHPSMSSRDLWKCYVRGQRGSSVAKSDPYVWIALPRSSSAEDRLGLLMWMDGFPMWTVAVGGEAII